MVLKHFLTPAECGVLTGIALWPYIYGHFLNKIGYDVVDYCHRLPANDGDFNAHQVSIGPPFVHAGVGLEAHLSVVQ